MTTKNVFKSGIKYLRFVIFIFYSLSCFAANEKISEYKQPDSVSQDELLILPDVKSQSSPSTVPQEANLDECRGFMVSEIIIKGNTLTQSDVIINKVSVKPGQILRKSDYFDTIQNLKNTQVFTAIELKFELVKKINRVNIIVNVKEKWTLIPYILGGSGGGTNYFVLGLYDTNFISRMYTANFAYGCKGVLCSTFIFFKNPSLLGSNISMVNQIYLQKNVFRFYNNQREITGAYINDQRLFSTTFDFKILESSTIGFGLTFFQNKISDSTITTADIDANKKYNFKHPESTNNGAYQVRFSTGKINYDGFMANGAENVSILESAPRGIDAREDKDYVSISNTFTLLKPLPLVKNVLFAFRGNVSATSSRNPSLWNFIGGLDKIRGFYDGEYSGQYSWFTNIEFRSVVYSNSVFGLQPVFFTDMGKAANIFQNNFQHIPVSIGPGLRIVFPKINKIVLRTDYAITLNPFRTYGFNVGVLQFF